MDQQSNSDPNSRLGRYLRSRGRTIPKDVHLFRVPNDNHALCLFCLKEHDYIEVKLRNQRDPGNRASVKFLYDVHCCKTCNREIIRMENFMFRGSEEENLFREEYEGLVNAAQRRLRSFLEEGWLEANFRHYVTHLNPKIESDEIGKHNKLCYGCQRNLRAAGYIQAPQGADPWVLDGGRLKLCVDCAMQLELMEKDMAYTKPAITTTDSCPTCRQKYEVTLSEYDGRIVTDPPTHGEHMCPKCTYNNLTISSHTPNSLYKIIRNDFDEIERYIFVKCAYCTEDIQVDQTLNPNFLLKRYVAVNGKYICDGCYQYGYPPELCYRSSHSDSEGMVWMFFKHDQKLRMVRRRSGEVKILETRYSALDVDSISDELLALTEDLFVGKQVVLKM